MLTQAPPVTFTRHRFTLAEYHQFIEAGIFKEDDRLELIRGEVMDMSPINARHAGKVNRLVELFYERLAKRCIVAPQNPLHLDDSSEPEPDVALLKPRPDRYARAHPQPADVLLVIEVADTSLEYDRGIKASVYASSGISEYWVVNLTENCIEVFREPTPNGYRQQLKFWRADTLSLLAFPEVSVTASEILD